MQRLPQAAQNLVCLHRDPTHVRPGGGVGVQAGAHQLPAMQCKQGGKGALVQHEAFEGSGSGHGDTVGGVQGAG